MKKIATSSRSSYVSGGRRQGREANRPLVGQKILVTRARGQSKDLSDRLRRLGAQIIEIPSIEIHPPRSFAPLDNALSNIQTYDWLILTSVNGVMALFARFAALKEEGKAVPVEALRRLKIAAIGPATRAEIERHSLKVHVIPRRYVAEEVVDSLRNRVRGKRILLVRAMVARDVIPRKLREAGGDVQVVDAYETVAPESSRKELRTVLNYSGSRPTVITFTSSSTVQNFVKLFALRSDSSRSRLQSKKTIAPLKAALKGIALASIGPITSSSLRKFGLSVDVEASKYTIPGLVQSLSDHFQQG